MALIQSFEEISKQRLQTHKPVKCGYCSFIGDGNQRYLLLETYGSPDRVIPDKISQSVQLDEQSARDLIAIIRREFPNID